MYEKLNKIIQKPEPFEFYTRLELWNDKHISKGMLAAHLDPKIDAASRNKAFVDKSTNWIISHFQIDNSSKIIDFGCGPGLYTTSLAETGAIVKGVDFSERSINYAKKIDKEKRLHIDYYLQDYLEFSHNDKFDLIILIYCDFAVLSPKQRSVLLRKFRDLLSDDGHILLDVDSMARFNEATEKKTEYQYMPEAGFFSPTPHHLFSTEFKYEQCKVLLKKQTIIDQRREFEFYHWSQCYSLESLKSEFDDNGLSITEFYSDVTGKSYLDDSLVIAVVATKTT